MWSGRLGEMGVSSTAEVESGLDDIVMRCTVILSSSLEFMAELLNDILSREQDCLYMSCLYALLYLVKDLGC